MTAKEQQILDDLTKHLREKILRNVEDYVILCSDTGLKSRDVMPELMVFFSQLTTSFAASQFDLSAADFARYMFTKFKQARADEEDKD